MGLFSNTKGIETGRTGCLNDKFDGFHTKKPHLTLRKYSMRLFLNTKGIVNGVIESVIGKFNDFAQTKTYLKRTKNSNKFATQGYL